MFKILFLIFFLYSFFFSSPVLAQGQSFVSIVNPIRGNDFWEEKNQKPKDAVLGQVDILRQFNVAATWLIRYDALNDQEIINILDSLPGHEKGIFLEVTPSWAKETNTKYHTSENWHEAGSAFLSGYEREEREKLIDQAFAKFKQVFDYYPTSVGAWWIDAYSLAYMQKKYGIISALIVADQYSTDNYQIWGQYFGTPYYPSKKHALHPAQTKEDKLPVVVVQWAARDPVNGYGKGVEESTYSLQANDYIEYHKLGIKYFSSLIDIYTKEPSNRFSQVIVGLENTYSWEKYGSEYKKQIETLVEKERRRQFRVVTMSDFAKWYKNAFPDFSPTQLIVAEDPLGGEKEAVWFMNPYYRASWFFDKDGSRFRDIRQYVEGEEELCFQKSCNQVNFATSAIRVLDEVSFGHKWVIDVGKISDFKLSKNDEKYVVSYQNQAGRLRTIEFLPRDIVVDGKIFTIDGAILEATKHQLETEKSRLSLELGSFRWSPIDVVLKTGKFLVFLIVGCLTPGFLLIRKILPKGASFLQRMTLSIILGFTLITLLFYALSLLKMKQAIVLYLVINFVFLINKVFLRISKAFLRIKFKKEILANLPLKIKDKFDFLIIGTIFLGVIFQQLPTFKNGLSFPYGLGFWGPNTHDGIWHISLINQLTKNVPPQNPIYAGEILKNYHYFFDLLVAVTTYISAIPVLDLLFRFYPVTFSLLLGIGTYYIVRHFLNDRIENLEIKLALLFGVYLTYFAGSFGWIVEYLKVRHLGGESAFWANQSISFNLNPPFAISFLIVIAILLLLPNLKSKLSIVIASLLAGSLIAFKAYGAILILLSFILVGILKRNLPYIIIFILGFLISVLLVLANFSIGQQLIIFSPFWFVHSMIDSPDRVGWVRLSLARTTGWETGNWFKFITAETISFLVFLIGNLGTRAFALLALLKIKHIVRREDFLFIFVFAALAFIIPVLFIQAGNPWNTIQFLYYFLYISALLGGIVLAKIVTSIDKIVAIPLVLVFILITPINSWATANGYLSNQPHGFIGKKEKEALDFLKQQEDGVILTYPYDEKLKNKIAEPWPLNVYDSTAYISALSGKAVFVEDEPQNQILLTDYKRRVVAAKDFFQNPNLEGMKFLSNNNISYIYIPKIFNLKLEESTKNYKNIFENDEVVLYKVNK